MQYLQVILYVLMEVSMFLIILINVLVASMMTWIFILIRKHAIKKNIKKFDINIVILTIIVASGIFYNFKNYPNMLEFMTKSIVLLLSLIVYIFISMKLFRKANSQKGV